MDIEEMKRNKFKKFVLAVLFAILVILGLNNSVYATDSITLKSISGKYTWSVSGTDYNYAKVIKSVYDLSNDNLKDQTLPNSIKELNPGFKIGATTNAYYDDRDDPEKLFNIYSTIGNVDYDTYCKYFVQSVCIHPSVNLNTATNTTYVQKVLFISKDQLTLYYTDSLSTGSVKKESESTGTSSAYFNKILQEAYSAKSSVDAAEHLRYHIADDNFHKAIKNCGITNWKLMAGNNFSTNCTSSDDEYNYYGIFIFVGTGGNGSQGRIIFDVYREEKQKPVEVYLQKVDMDTGKQIGTAKINITSKENVKSIVTSTGKTEGLEIGKVKITVNPADTNKGYFKIGIEETDSPDNYIGFTGEITVTVYYDANGNVTKTESTDTTHIPNTTNTNIIQIKNKYNPPVGLRFYKTDISGKTYLEGSTIKIEAGDNVKSFGSQDEWKNGKRSNNKGYYGGFVVQPESNTGKFSLKITEITAPDGYNVILDEGKTVTLTVSYNQKTGEPTNITVADSYKRNFEWGGTVDGTNVDKAGVIKIKDDPRIIQDLIINKKDKSNAGAVEGAIFKVYFNNITYVKINGKKYVVEDIIEENKIIDRNGTKYYTKTANGLTLLVPTKESTEDYDNRLYIEGLKTDKNGQIKIDEIEAIENRDTVYVTVTEMESISGFAKLPDSAKLLLRYNNNNSNKWELFIREKQTDLKRFDELDAGNANTLSKDYYSVSKGDLTLTLKDDFKIDKLTILKTDSQSSSTKLQGAKFNITLSNIKSAKGYSANASGKITLTGVTTDANGNIVLEDLVISNINNPITITIEETQAPIGYKKLEGKITVTLTRSGSTYKISATKDSSISDNEFKTDNVKVENNEVVLNINNIPVMNLGGIVWEDGQTGVKDVTLPDGTKGDKEKGIAGIQITLYKEGESNPITKDIYGNTLMTKTASAGDKLTYKMYNGKTDTITLEAGEYIFPNLEKGTKYYVVFTYDGINYKTSTISQNLYENNDQSKVNEVGRDTFNAKFQTITDSTTTDTNTNSYAKANGVSGDLVYSYVGEGTSTLVTTDSKGVLDQYKMTAKSVNYLKTATDWKATWTNDGKINKNHYALDINCGLEKRFFDLAIGMDVESAKLTINDKETTYSYNQILDGALDKAITVEELLGKLQDNSKIEYNEYIDWSDYNYRISDYIMNATEKKDVTEASVDNGTEDAEEIISNTDINKQLRAFVTYKVVLMNQSTINSAQVNELAYYYDENFNFVSVGRAVDETGKAINGEGINFDTNASLDNLEGKKSAKVTGFAQKLSSTADYRQVLYFTFEIQRDSNGALPAKIGEDGLKVANIVEILTYQTDEGLLDNDSCPGNAAIGYKYDKVDYEDDTYKAPGLNITVTNNARTISGVVWNDSTDSNATNGVKNEDAKGINDVIVQLIEVKKINGKYYEYIWQETRSGGNTVKTTNRNGYPGNSYTVSNQEGQYQFTGFIPGNYIIRFIYGDGRTYDITDNVKTYNGQDYQSTVDNNYKAEWYNTSNYGNNSVARDNEARRLKVMSYSTTIDKDKWEAIENKTLEMLQNTWMCAETSRINVQIDATDEDMKTTKDITAVSFEYKDKSITYNDMNFGLIVRPQTKLVLEKHMTGLKITPTGTGVQPIVDARANISQILNNTEIATEGITTGLSTIKSSRDERGFWKVETDIEELAQGATLEIEYTYVIKNESDEDYLSENLVNEYEANINKDQDNNGKDDYVDYLTGAISDTKSRTKGNTHLYGNYLGQYYYTKTKASTDKEVLSRVDTVEDYLENQLKLSEQSSGAYFEKSNTENVTQKMYDTEGYKKDLTIETVIQNKEVFNFIAAKGENEIKSENTDYTKTVSLETTLSASNKEISYLGYIAQIMQYSNAAGRRDMDACPGNLSYIHSEDNEITLNSYVQYNNDGTRITSVSKTLEAGYVRINEDDEYWGLGERLMITKPTGEDKQEPLQIAIIAISGIAVLGVGIVLIKKFVLKK